MQNDSLARQFALKRAHERVDLSDGLSPVAAFGLARALPRLEAVVAVLQPVDADRARELVGGDLVAAAEGIAFPLHDEGRSLDDLKVVHPQLVRLAYGMKRIAQTNEARDGRLVGDHAGDPPAHRFAADDEAVATELFDDGEPRLAKDRFAVGRSAFALPTSGHIRELETDNAMPTLRQPPCHRLHKRVIHARAGAVGQCNGPFGVLGAVDAKVGIGGHGILRNANRSQPLKIVPPPTGSDYRETNRVRRITLLVACCGSILFADGSPLFAKGGARQYINKPAAWYSTAEARQVAANILSYQSDLGGWPKNIDTTAAPFSGKRKDLQPTFDNDATTDELRVLAQMYGATHDSQYRAAFERGLTYILEAQYPNGGWPQFFPPGRKYNRYITFNDDAMVRLMRFLQEIDHSAVYDFVGSERRERHSTGGSTAF
jgi:Pectic acid lyase